jgi:subtilisin-like proprotein convertase family protein/uncharacterized protein YvpB
VENRYRFHELPISLPVENHLLQSLDMKNILPGLILVIIFLLFIFPSAATSLASAESILALEDFTATSESTVDMSAANQTRTATLEPATEIGMPGLISDTETPTPTPTQAPIFAPYVARMEQPTATDTPTPTETPTATPTQTPDPNIMPEHVLYCASPQVGIPDDNASGVSSEMLISDWRYVVNLELRLSIDHTWVGDLSASLTHADTAKQITLLDRPGHPAVNTGCEYNDIASILGDRLSLPVENQCVASPAAISGSFLPDQPLNTFRTDSLAGSWILNIADHYHNDTGTLTDWCISAEVYDIPILPPPPPELPPLPEQVSLSISGKGQALPLDCETRSAVDWAKYLGVAINEYEFFNALPSSDNPDAGFVGNVYGAWGQIPPNDYGVHAEPIAALLRQYGLPAYAHRPLSFDQLRAELAAYRPVIVWIIGDHTPPYPYEHILDYEIPYFYRSSDNHLSVVARYEHTVVAVGYTSNTVSYLDGPYIKTISRERFLSSWSVMRNMAVTASP